MSVSNYLPKELTMMQKLIPGAKQRFEKEVIESQSYYKQDLDRWKVREEERVRKIKSAKADHEQKTNTLLEEIKAHNADIEKFQQDFSKGDPHAIVNYFTLVLEASSYPDEFPQIAKLAFVPESKQLVIEYDLPPFEVVPEVSLYKYVKTKDEITTSKRPVTQRKALYASITAQIALRTVHELFEADRTKQLDTIVFSGFVESINRATGRDQRTCLISVRTTRDVFIEIDLAKVDPILCLKNLNAAVSKNPDELEAVRPILEFNMVDKRFIQETDVLSTLDQRPNLMDLTPSEFESLITNLFAKMGLETRLTQASRDGGVDCVAYDPRPVLGGKVVIQAKRYKHTVGVSAVRDLFGTMHNEGATKGIIVTTSGYGKAAFEFADGKPLELLSGSNLLYLLAEHAGIEAKIEVPDDWKDLNPDTPE
jgi:restriction system protein